MANIYHAILFVVSLNLAVTSVPYVRAFTREFKHAWATRDK